MKHVLYEPEFSEGIAACRSCLGVEGSLTLTDCPEKAMTPFHVMKVYLESWDFVNGCWIVPDLEKLIK